jgi:phosphoglucosamine mutase
LWETIRQIEEEMKGIGRVLVRPSGTEPLVRVLVEAKDNSVLELYAKRVIDAILKSSAKA